LTCSRFRRISRPFLFESIDIVRARARSSNTSGLSPSAKIFHARFRDDASLRSHCRRLKVHFTYISKSDYALLEDLMSWLINVRYLSIAGIFMFPRPVNGAEHVNELSYQYDMWALVRVISRHMRRLEVLRCRDHWSDGFRGNNFIQNINIPSLKKIEDWGACSK
jgi:hypothetical protein